MDKIYKYFPCNNYNLDSFNNKYLWFSKPRFFNDPFDCNMEIINNYNTFCNKIYKLNPTAKNTIVNDTKDFGICCFSETNTNLHMWAHYANSHQGICIEYKYSEKDFDDYFSFNVLYCKCTLQNVDYREQMINLNGIIELSEFKQYEITEIVKDEKLLNELFEKLLLQKNKQTWANEKEHRLLLMGRAKKNIREKIAKECNELETGYKIPIKPNMITTVIFGYRTSEDMKNKIKSIFGDLTTYKQIELDYDNWSLKIKGESSDRKKESLLCKIREWLKKVCKTCMSFFKNLRYCK